MFYCKKPKPFGKRISNVSTLLNKERFKASRLLAVLFLGAGFLTSEVSFTVAQNAQDAQGSENASDRGRERGTANGEANGIDDGLTPAVPPGFEDLANGNGNGNANGNGNQFCSIMVIEQGTFGAAIENTELSSKLFGGRAGAATVTTSSGSFSLSIDPPLGFSSAPRGGTGNVNMTASYLGNGATNFSETPGTVNIRLRNGTTNVQTHLTAARADATPFPAGDYRAEITLRCE